MTPYIRHKGGKVNGFENVDVFFVGSAYRCDVGYLLAILSIITNVHWYCGKVVTRYAIG